MNKLYCVITTIQQPTNDVIALSKNADVSIMIVIGDKKGPTSFDLAGADFYDLSKQLSLPYELATKLPVGTYARKNIGYLIAMSEGAPCIYETDDDNVPLPNWKKRKEYTETLEVDKKGWVNAYSHFSNERIWPRGLPLDQIISLDAGYSSDSNLPLKLMHSPIQQGLANGSPDVDAIWRLVLDHNFTFEEKQSIHLNSGAWCPFNSQSTWWWPKAYTLMYLPSFCSFRMTDIWRSFVAQRCLWVLGHGVVFHAAEVLQQRNEHDLMLDFNDEIPGYQRNKELAHILEGLSLESGEDMIGANMRTCYSALIEKGFFPDKELNLVDAWLEDISSHYKGV